MASHTYRRSYRGTRRRPIYFCGFLVILLLAVGFFLFRQTRDKTRWNTYQNDELGVALEWPETFAATDLTEQEQAANIVFRITREEPSALFSLRFESGLGPLKLAGGTVFDALVEAINRRYPDRFPDYKKEKYEEFTLAAEKAALFEFTYLGTDGETRMKQRFVLVVKDNAAYYLSCQAPETEFSKSAADFERIAEGFEFL